MNYTTNLGLSKPVLKEKYYIEVSNANMDLIDSAISKLNEKIVDTDTSTITYEQIDALFE